MSKPAILVLADVPNWAWSAKAAGLRRCLSDEFSVDVAYRAHYYAAPSEPEWGRYDLVHTFEVAQVQPQVVPESYRGKLVSGLTAHVVRYHSPGNPGYGENRVRAWASRCDALHANSLLLLEEVKPFHPHVYYCPNGVDAAYWHRYRDRAGTEVTFAHVGKPKARKGYPLVRDLLKQVGAPLLTCYRTAHDALPPSVIREFYQDAHVQIVYSDKDGTPCTALESAACENAIISNHIGNMKEVLTGGPCGLLIERTPEALEEAVRWCTAHLGDVVAMGEEARRVVLREWTWETTSRCVRQMWREVLGC